MSAVPATPDLDESPPVVAREGQSGPACGAADAPVSLPAARRADRRRGAGLSRLGQPSAERTGAGPGHKPRLQSLRDGGVVNLPVLELQHSIGNMRFGRPASTGPAALGRDAAAPGLGFRALQSVCHITGRDITVPEHHSDQPPPAAVLSPAAVQPLQAAAQSACSGHEQLIIDAATQPSDESSGALVVVIDSDSDADSQRAVGPSLNPETPSHAAAAGAPGGARLGRRSSVVAGRLPDARVANAQDAAAAQPPASPRTAAELPDAGVASPCRQVASACEHGHEEPAAVAMRSTDAEPRLDPARAAACRRAFRRFGKQQAAFDCTDRCMNRPLSRRKAMTQSECNLVESLTCQHSRMCVPRIVEMRIRTEGGRLCPAAGSQMHHINC